MTSRRRLRFLRQRQMLRAHLLEQGEEEEEVVVAVVVAVAVEVAVSVALA